MGYYTYFGFYSAVNPQTNEDLDKKPFANWLNERVGLKLFDSFGDCFQETKWYDFDRDVMDLSTEYPGILFHFGGEGSDSEDIWEAWVYNGKLVVKEVQFIYPDLEEDDYIQLGLPVPVKKEE